MILLILLYFCIFYPIGVFVSLITKQNKRIRCVCSCTFGRRENNGQKNGENIPYLRKTSGKNLNMKCNDQIILHMDILLVVSSS